MAQVRIEIDVSQLGRLAKRIERLADIDRQALLEGIGAAVEEQTRRRIEEERTSPDGEPWPKWSPRYERTRGPEHSLLVGEGFPGLLESIQYFIQGDQVEVGSPLEYAAIHQFGGDEVGIPIPARPYLGLSPENEAEVLQVVEDFLDRELEAL